MHLQIRPAIASAGDNSATRPIIRLLLLLYNDKSTPMVSPSLTSAPTRRLPSSKINRAASTALETLITRAVLFLSIYVLVDESSTPFACPSFILLLFTFFIFPPSISVIPKTSLHLCIGQKRDDRRIPEPGATSLRSLAVVWDYPGIRNYRTKVKGYKRKSFYCGDLCRASGRWN